VLAQGCVSSTASMSAGVRARELAFVNGDRALGSGLPPARFVVVERTARIRNETRTIILLSEASHQCYASDRLPASFKPAAAHNFIWFAGNGRSMVLFMPRREKRWKDEMGRDETVMIDYLRPLINATLTI